MGRKEWEKQAPIPFPKDGEETTVLTTVAPTPTKFRGKEGAFTIMTEEGRRLIWGNQLSVLMDLLSQEAGGIEKEWNDKVIIRWAQDQESDKPAIFPVSYQSVLKK